MFTCLTTVAVKLLKQPMNKKGPSTLAALQSGRSHSDVFVYMSRLISSQRTRAMEASTLFLGKSFLSAVRPCSSDAAFLPHPMWLI